MRTRTLQSLLPLFVSLLWLAACSKGGEGDSCFEDRHCRGSLVCCNASSTTRGTCEEECEPLPGGDGGTDASVEDATVEDADVGDGAVEDADVGDAADLDADLDASEGSDAAS